MIRLKHLHWIGPAAALLLLAACASTNLAPIGREAQFRPEDDERQLWDAARQAEERVLPARLRYADSAIKAYLQQLADKLTPRDYTGAG